MALSDWYPACKALHLIGMVSWMAGMFYLVRIMVYHALLDSRPAAERALLALQYTLMEWKAYRIILQPAVVITWTFGVLLLVLQPAWLQQGWMHVKLFLLVLLTGYTHALKGRIRHLEAGTDTLTHTHYRALNEVPTVFLVGIVFLAVLKNSINYAMLGMGLLLFVALLGWGIRSVARREGKQ